MMNSLGLYYRLAGMSQEGQQRVMTRIKISAKGQITLPGRIRRRLSLQQGDCLDAKIDGERIILTPRRARRVRLRIVRGPVTGLPVLTCGPDALKLTTKQVREILADFP